MTKLHVFDMDGTLLRGASVEAVSRLGGCFDEVTELERAYLRGEVTDEVAWWERVLELWAHMSDDRIFDAFDRAPWISGVPDVFSDIAARGEHSVVISQSPLFLVRRLERWGVEATFASTVERGVPVSPDQLLSAEDKVRITDRLLAEHELSASDCVAYGDSTSDVELFRVFRNTVGVNASELLRPLAARNYVGDDLRAAYGIGRSLLEPRA
jgi:phosphoserine phosphatase